jgi:hypothetical protein
MSWAFSRYQVHICEKFLVLFNVYGGMSGGLRGLYHQFFLRDYTHCQPIIISVFAGHILTVPY